ncbi:unnamed protein product [Microthlaspi erraticum]|uniref:Uncharacterized protein n=1 Tax=Microthlaspi erraticum TaxID=1685480 RepID=A0A6D2KEH8_9BRAS|nr:unnamed protein product [Microthlaspi erraticum]
MYPNGSRMIAVDIDTASSLKPFPFDADGRDFVHCYTGDGISTTGGYGFRCPGWKPGSLFVTSNDLLVFVGRESKDVFTLQRVLNLEEILKKGLGLCLPPLPPTMNFTFMKKSYTNVFAKSYALHQSWKWDSLPCLD